MSCIKIIELIGCSGNSYEDAIKNALDEAAKTIRNITGVKVLNHNLKVKDNKIIQHRVNVRVAFEVER